ncbi:uncharacterized protein EDB91DRAFT_1079154 [Suillus paluster]|uniref:uncharacterized protein n=1 Tax=Suillus paluster TaxID=48578 RepID=UPI001B87581D|nr:uncharacterized protein EDB91DRAFT_1079154 [Suillus paluster]KAG1749058.1 hypothetical protein EDB91DRAFT_1079154 [Suillus paluster]
MFGAPNGLCLSITESKHIKAVKQPWRRSSKYNTLSQMLLTNQRLDKVAAARVDFTTCSMLKGSCAFSYYNSFVENPSYISNDDGDPEVQQNRVHAGSNPFAIESDNFDDVEDQGVVDDVDVIADVQLVRTFQRKCARTVADLTDELDIPSFPTFIHLFLYDQIHTDNHHSSANVPLRDCPSYTGPIKIFHSAAATFIAPSDPSGITVQWFHRIAEERDKLTGMWMVALVF